MRLGVLFCAYDCAPLLSQVLQPWLEARREIDIKIAAVHGQFKEYHDLGIEDDDKDTLFRLLDTYSKNIITYLFVQSLDEPVKYRTEAELRNKGLRCLLNEKCDAVILLDGDEIYTIEDIKNIYNYIQKDPFIALYKIKMRNLVFDSNHYTLDFCPPRIWKHRLNNYTLSHFTFDNDCAYKENNAENLKSDKDFPCKIIPNVLPLHHSWNDLERSKKKILYQEKRWSPPNGNGCSFKIEDNKICLNLDFYKRINQTPPEVFEL